MLKIEWKINNGERLNLLDYVVFFSISLCICAALFLLFYLACGAAYVLAG